METWSLLLAAARANVENLRLFSKFGGIERSMAMFMATENEAVAGAIIVTQATV